MCRVLLLTGQRREEVAGMRRSEIRDGVWHIPAARDKGKRDRVLPLSHHVLAILAELPRTGDLYFSTNGRTAFSGFSKAKRALDAKLSGHENEKATLPARLAAKNTKGLYFTHWTLHDLRRTARTLMARDSIRPEVAERVLGHVIPGVEGIYDRHGYQNEQKIALNRLADLVLRIAEQDASESS